MKRPPQDGGAYERLHPSQTVPGAWKKTSTGGKQPLPSSAATQENDDDATHWEVRIEAACKLLAELIQEGTTPNAIGARVIQRYDELIGQKLIWGCELPVAQWHEQKSREISIEVLLLAKGRHRSLGTIGRRTLCLALIVSHWSVYGKCPADLAREIGVTRECISNLIRELTDAMPELYKRPGFKVWCQRSQDAVLKLVSEQLSVAGHLPATAPLAQHGEEHLHTLSRKLDPAQR